jgi:hypothetical protein
MSMQLKKLISEYDNHLQQAISVTKSKRYQYIRYVQRFLSEAFIEAVSSW